MDTAAGTSAVWRYNPESFRGYRLNDDPTRRDGLWSDIASISVMG